MLCFAISCGVQRIMWSVVRLVCSGGNCGHWKRKIERCIGCFGLCDFRNGEGENSVTCFCVRCPPIIVMCFFFFGGEGVVVMLHWADRFTIWEMTPNNAEVRQRALLSCGYTLRVSYVTRSVHFLFIFVLFLCIYISISVKHQHKVCRLSTFWISSTFPLMILQGLKCENVLRFC